MLKVNKVIWKIQPGVWGRTQKGILAHLELESHDQV